MFTYTPPKPSATGFAAYSELGLAQERMCVDLWPHITEFDGIVTAGDFHGVALGSLVSASLGKPLMIVCAQPHGEVVSHIVTIGDVHPDMRWLYVDDFCAFGASWAYVSGYLSLSEPANVVARYQYLKRQYSPLEG